MAKRKPIPKATQDELLYLCARRCCLCFGLRADFGEQSGQIAHLDHDPSNNNLDNLAWLCLHHHDEYDRRTSQSKGLTIGEVKRYRQELYQAVAEMRATQPPTDRQAPAGSQIDTGRAASREADSPQLEKTGQPLAGPPGAGKPRIFLCHAHDDKPRVRELYRQLQEAGYAPWLDEEDLLPGQDREAEIKKVISDPYNLVVVFLSANSITRRGSVQREIKQALDVLLEMPEGAIYLIPARLEDCRPPDQLSDLHGVDLFEAVGFERLTRALDFEMTKRQPPAGDL